MWPCMVAMDKYINKTDCSSRRPIVACLQGGSRCIPVQLDFSSKDSSGIEYLVLHLALNHCSYGVLSSLIIEDLSLPLSLSVTRTHSITYTASHTHICSHTYQQC